MLTRKNYRVTGRIDRKRGVITEYRTSLDAARLIEDVQTLALILDLLQSVDADSLTEIESIKDYEFAYQMHRSTVALVKSWHRIAKLKLRRQYLR
jgi:hypothetical protein